MAARVVDLPLPVGPVTKIRPFSRLIMCLKICGAFNSSRDGILIGIIRKAAAKSPFMV